jgi:HlyD family secretion protein
MTTPEGKASEAQTASGVKPTDEKKIIADMDTIGEALPDLPASPAMVSVKRNLTYGMAAVILLVGGVGGWAATAHLDGAVIAAGNLVVESSSKKVQHPNGGIVGEIHAKDGMKVNAGDLLVKLDETVIRANLQIVSNNLDVFEAQRARLVAERDGAKEITVPDIFKYRLHDPMVQALLRGEQNLFEARAASLKGQQVQLDERAKQLRDEIVGLENQRSAKEAETVIIKDELKGVTELWKKNLVQINRLTSLQREATRIEGDRGQLTAAIATTRGKIAEIEIQKLQLIQNFLTDLLKDLKEAEARINELVERKIAAEDQMRRIDIRAPVTGIVHQLTVHTIGGVIAAGDPIMLVVPQSDVLEVEARVAPQDIDLLHMDQKAIVRFQTFNQRTTPEINGTVTRVGADLTREPQTGQAYYLVRVAVAADEVRRLGNVRLVPGMPVETHIATGSRIAISYFVKPLTDQFSKAFKER